MSVANKIFMVSSGSTCVSEGPDMFYIYYIEWHLIFNTQIDMQYQIRIIEWITFDW